MPRLQELRALCLIVEQKSFSRAAEILDLTQPAVSLQIKSLEAEYGTRLLHRAGPEIVPTENGQVVYELACQIVDLFERSKQQVRDLDGRVEGKLVLGASTGPGEHLLPKLLGRFKKRHPDVSISLRVGDSREIIDQVVRQRLELGFVGTQRRDQSLVFSPLIDDQLVVVVPPQHPWSNRSQIAYHELAQAPLIVQQQGSGATAALFDALAEYDIQASSLNIIMELGLQESTKTAVRNGLGATIISRLGVLEELQRGVLIEVAVEGMELSRAVYAVHSRVSPLTNLTRSFLEFASLAVGDLV